MYSVFFLYEIYVLRQNQLKMFILSLEQIHIDSLNLHYQEEMRRPMEIFVHLCSLSKEFYINFFQRHVYVFEFKIQVFNKSSVSCLFRNS